MNDEALQLLKRTWMNDESSSIIQFWIDQLLPDIIMSVLNKQTNHNKEFDWNYKTNLNGFHLNIN